MKSNAAVRVLSVLFETAHNVAKHLIASNGWTAAGSKAESFEILAAEKVMPGQLADSFCQAARFRNLITYQTPIVNNNVVYDVLRNHLGDFEGFASHVAWWIELHQQEGADNVQES